MAVYIQNLETRPGSDGESKIMSTGVQSLLASAMSAISRPAKRDSSPDPPNMIPVHARRFNHLGVWAYIAVGFIILASLAVTAYVGYSCYHSSRVVTRRQGGSTTGPSQRGGSRGIKHVEEATGIVRVSDGDSKLSEKLKIEGNKSARVVVEMKAFGGGRSYAKNSESKHDMINKSSSPRMSQASLANINDSSFDTDIDCSSLSSPPLAHNSEEAPAYVPFHLPSPPSSPVPAHKRNVEHHRTGLLSSPPSPLLPRSPTDSPLLIVPKYNSYGMRIQYDESANFSSKYAESPDGKGRGIGHDQKEAPGAKFDSHNIRFLPPLNPFVTQSTAKIWNESKLSPINGSIISPSSSPGNSAQGLSKTLGGTSRSESLESTPVTATTARARLISGPLLPVAKPIPGGF